MGNIEVRITDTKVGEAGKRMKEYFIRDTALFGFHVRVYKNGTKVYGINVWDGKFQRHVAIGRHGDGWNAETARKEAERIKHNVVNGLDPLIHRLETQPLMTLNDLYKGWMAAKVLPHLAKATSDKYKSLYENYVPKNIRKMRVGELDKKTFRELHEKIRNMGTRKSEIPGQANKVIIMLRTMFSWVIGQGGSDSGGLKENPAIGFDLYSEPEYSTILKPFEEKTFVQFMRAEMIKASIWQTKDRQRKEDLLIWKFKKIEGQSMKRPRLKKMDAYKFHPTALAAIWFIFLSGVRHREALSLRWQQVDFEKNIIKFNITKQGSKAKKSNKEKVLSLIAPIRDLFNSLSRDSPFVFPSDGRIPSETGHWVNIEDTWEKLREEIGLGKSRTEVVNGEVAPAPVRIHDLRHTYATSLMVSGMNLKQVQTAMGHNSQQSTMRYLHAVQEGLDGAIEKVIEKRLIAADS